MIIKPDSISKLELRPWNIALNAAISIWLLFFIYKYGLILYNVMLRQGRTTSFWTPLMLAGFIVVLLCLWIKPAYASSRFKFFMITFFSIYLGTLIADLGIFIYRRSFQDISSIQSIFWAQMAGAALIPLFLSVNWKTALEYICPVAGLFAVLYGGLKLINNYHSDPSLNLIFIACALMFFFFPYFSIRLAHFCITLVAVFITMFASIVNAMIRR